MIQNFSSTISTTKLIWIVEDNLLVLNILKNAISKKFPDNKIVGYSSIYKAALDLCKTKAIDYPDTMILDFDYGEEGNVEYFLNFVKYLDNYQKFSVILHTDTPENQLKNALSSPLVKRFIPKSPDLLPLIRALVLN